MKAKNIFLVAGLSMALSAAAAPLTPQQALERARSNGPARMAAKIPASAKPVYSAKAESGTVGAYVFNNPGAGYVILAADDVAYPVLGYSDSGSIDVNNMSPELKWWLGEYARQIEWANEVGVNTALRSPAYKEGRPAIPTLMKSRWDQGSPYNEQCPKPKGSDLRCYTGCVATSMAQVMYYHKYPEIGEGIAQYTCSSLGRKLTLNLEREAFDWGNMMDIYQSGQYTEAQGDAVAYLMKCCGYTVEMNYGLDASGAQGSSIAPALRKYFKYDAGVVDRQRIMYSGTQWEEMIYNNLKNVGPVVMNGQSPLQGGHSFVCDGYDGNGYFHFNWGWSGISDGYYSLDALNPDAQGAGGAVGGFNFYQNAIFGIQPPTGEAPAPEVAHILQYGSTTATIDGRTVTFDVRNFMQLGWGSTDTEESRFNIGAVIEPADGTSGEKQSVEGKLGDMTEISLSGYYSYYPSSRVKPVVTLPALADGTYKVYLASKDLDIENSVFEPVETPWGLVNYFMLNVSGGTYTATNVATSELTFSDIQLLSPLYAGKNVKFGAKVKNSSDIELCQGLTPQLCDNRGNVVFTGESILFSLLPDESVEREWLSKFYKADGTVASVSKDTDFTLKFFDPQTGLYFNGVEMPVTLKPNPGAATVMLTGFNIEGAEKTDTTILDRHFYALYRVMNPLDMTVDLSFKVTKGYYDGTVSIGIAQQNPQNPQTDLPLLDGVWTYSPFLERNETADLHIPVSFPAEAGIVYFINATYTLNNSVRNFGSIPFMIHPDSGVVEILDSDAPIEYYNMQGMRIENPTPGQLVIVRQGSKSYKCIWK